MIWGGDRIRGEMGWRNEAEMREFFDLVAGSGDVEQWFRAKPSSYSD